MDFNSILIGSADPRRLTEYCQLEGPVGWIATLADPDGNYFQLMSPFAPDEADARG
ncbi:MAG TPA: hypothetical protein VFR93_03910 [Candidatus Limnocylindrales bacterium]|nr:hypothetical protein [Candidatus Limnocylindrales bacterium]